MFCLLYLLSLEDKGSLSALVSISVLRHSPLPSPPPISKTTSPCDWTQAAEPPHPTPPSQVCLSAKHNTNSLKNSFVPRAIKLYNTTL